MTMESFFNALRNFGVGHRSLDDTLFQGDKPLPKFGVIDLDQERLCHNVITMICQVPGCKFISETLLEFENHYNSSHRYSCSQCKKVLPSPHLLDLHLQETHDSFFAVLCTKKPSYCCYNEDCKEKFMTANERLLHCVKIHKYPKDFRFDQSIKPKKQKINKVSHKMDTDMPESCSDMYISLKSDIFVLKNNKQKTFVKYTNNKVTHESNSNKSVDIDSAMTDLKNCLPD